MYWYKNRYNASEISQDLGDHIYQAIKQRKELQLYICKDINTKKNIYSVYQGYFKLKTNTWSLHIPIMLIKTTILSSWKKADLESLFKLPPVA